MLTPFLLDFLGNDIDLIRFQMSLDIIKLFSLVISV